MEYSILPVNNLLKAKAKNSSGEELGIIEDVILDKHHKSVKCLILRCKDFVGKGHRFFAVPICSELVKIKNMGSVIINADEKSLFVARGFSFDNFPKLNTAISEPSIIELYNYPHQTKVKSKNLNQ